MTLSIITNLTDPLTITMSTHRFRHYTPGLTGQPIVVSCCQQPEMASVTAGSAATLTGVSLKNLRVLAEAGFIRVARPTPGTTFFYPQEIEAFIRKTETDPDFWNQVRKATYLKGLRELKIGRHLLSQFGSPCQTFPEALTVFPVSLRRLKLRFRLYFQAVCSRDLRGQHFGDLPLKAQILFLKFCNLKLRGELLIRRCFLICRHWITCGHRP